MSVVDHNYLLMNLPGYAEVHETMMAQLNRPAYVSALAPDTSSDISALLAEEIRNLDLNAPALLPSTTEFINQNFQHLREELDALGKVDALAYSPDPTTLSDFSMSAEEFGDYITPFQDLEVSPWLLNILDYPNPLSNSSGVFPSSFAWALPEWESVPAEPDSSSSGTLGRDQSINFDQANPYQTFYLIDQISEQIVGVGYCPEPPI